MTTEPVDLLEFLDPPLPAQDDESQGFWIHFLQPMTLVISGSFLGMGQAVGYGDEYHVPPSKPGQPGFVEWNSDRNGRSPFSLTEEQQVETYGVVKWRRGRWPKDKLRVDPVQSPLDFAEQREAARTAAHRLPEAERAPALQAVQDRFGRAPVTSRTLRQVPDRNMP